MTSVFSLVFCPVWLPYGHGRHIRLPPSGSYINSVNEGKHTTQNDEGQRALAVEQIYAMNHYAGSCLTLSSSPLTRKSRPRIGEKCMRKKNKTIAGQERATDIRSGNGSKKKRGALIAHRLAILQELGTPFNQLDIRQASISLVSPLFCFLAVACQ